MKVKVATPWPRSIGSRTMKTVLSMCLREARAKENLTRVGLRNALETLDERSRRVIEARWLNEDREGNVTPLTLQELAKELGVSAERIRQIEKKALAKMRAALMPQKDSLD